jgi:hypothetical protein
MVFVTHSHAQSISDDRETQSYKILLIPRKESGWMDAEEDAAMCDDVNIGTLITV